MPRRPSRQRASRRHRRRPPRASRSWRRCRRCPWCAPSARLYRLSCPARRRIALYLEPLPLLRCKCHVACSCTARRASMISRPFPTAAVAECWCWCVGSLHGCRLVGQGCPRSASPVGFAPVTSPALTCWQLASVTPCRQTILKAWVLTMGLRVLFRRTSRRRARTTWARAARRW